MRHNLRTALWLLALAVVCLALDRAVGAPGDVLRPAITLAWDQHPDTNVTGFRIYTRTNVAAGAWVQLAAVTNAPTTNFTLYVTSLPAWSLGYRGPYFFALTATNYWLESDFSNVVSIPDAPSADVKLRLALP